MKNGDVPQSTRPLRPPPFFPSASIEVKSRKIGNKQDNQDKSSSSKEMNNSQANSHGPSKKKPS